MNKTGRMKTASFENFPWRMIAISNAVGLGTYAIGLSLMARLGIVWALLYAAYCIWMEWRLLSGSWSLVPLVAGIAVLIVNFSLPALLAVVTLAFLGTAGTGLVRGQIACKYCKQRELGCPAEQLFSKSINTVHSR